jgi:hypothetical protein
MLFESDEYRILSDTFDITPGNDGSVFRRKRGEKSVAGDDQRGYFSRAGVYLQIADAAEQTAVAKVDDLLAFKLGKAGYDGY